VQLTIIKIKKPTIDENVIVVLEGQPLQSQDGFKAVIEKKASVKSAGIKVRIKKYLECFT
jgi:hypothetical protein